MKLKLGDRTAGGSCFSSAQPVWIDFFQLLQNFIIMASSHLFKSLVSCTVGSTFSVFSSTQSTWLISRRHLVVVAFPVCTFSACLLWILCLCFLWPSIVHVFFGLDCASVRSSPTHVSIDSPSLFSLWLLKT